MVFPDYSCDFCGNRDFRILFFSRDLNRKVTDETFGIYECPGCRLVFTHPQPDDLSMYYPAKYYHTHKNFDSAKNLAKNARVLNKLKKYKPVGNLLDVGCNIGSLVKAASDTGFTASGIDTSQDAVSYARNILSVNALCDDFIHYDFGGDSFDVITISHVLEHTRRPSETLKKTFHLLKQGGVLYLSVPDFGSLQSRIFGGRWFHLDVPRHLYHFRKDILTNILKSIGFSIINIEPGPEPFDLSGFRGSLLRDNLLTDIKLVKGMAKKILGIIGVPFIKIERRFYGGASFEVIAGK